MRNLLLQETKTKTKKKPLIQKVLLIPQNTKLDIQALPLCRLFACLFTFVVRLADIFRFFESYLNPHEGP